MLSLSEIVFMGKVVIGLAKRILARLTPVTPTGGRTEVALAEIIEICRTFLNSN